VWTGDGFYQWRSYLMTEQREWTKPQKSGNRRRSEVARSRPRFAPPEGNIQFDKYSSTPIITDRDPRRPASNPDNPRRLCLVPPRTDRACGFDLPNSTESSKPRALSTTANRDSLGVSLIGVIWRPGTIESHASCVDVFQTPLMGRNVRLPKQHQGRIPSAPYSVLCQKKLAPPQCLFERLNPEGPSSTISIVKPSAVNFGCRSTWGA